MAESTSAVEQGLAARIPVMAKSPVDEVLPAGNLILFWLQHVLLMAASPITSVFLVSKAPAGRFCLCHR